MSTLSTKTENSPVDRMIEIVAGFWAARAVHVAAKLGLADHLTDGPKTVEQLAAATSTHAPSLLRLLRALVGIEVLREVAPQRFASTPLGDTLHSGAADSMRAIAMSIIGAEHYDAWQAVEHSVRTGETAFDFVHQMPIWKFFRENPSNAKDFDQAMTDFTRAIDPAVLKAYDFAPFKRIIDVGGGHGELLSAILLKHPKVRGTVFDQPYVAEGAARKFAALNLSARADTVGGDFFESIPAGGDAYMMKFIIHDWDEPRSIRILSNIRKGIAPNGKLLLLETVLPEGNEPHFARFMDLNMLVMTGGRERTEREYADLLRQAGFHLARVVQTESVISVVEAVPA